MYYVTGKKGQLCRTSFSLPASGSHAHGRIESESCVCVCVHTCINFVDFMHIQMASLNKMPLDSNTWYTNVNPCCLQNFRCAFGSVLSSFKMGCLQLLPTEASNSWNQVFTFALDSL